MQQEANAITDAFNYYQMQPLPTKQLLISFVKLADKLQS